MAESIDGEDLPKGAVMVKDILESMGIKHYEPAVVTQLLEFLYRYMSEILQDAQAFGGPTAKEITMDDILLAVQAQETSQFTQPPPQEVLMQLAERRNVQPLPEIKKRFGLRLPPEEDCLLGGNYHLARGAAALASEPAQAMDTDRESAGQSSLRPSADAANRPHLQIELGGQAPGAAREQAPQMQAGQDQGPDRGTGSGAVLPQQNSGAPADDIEWI